MPAIEIARVNELIHLFGEHQKADMRAMRRESMKSVLFDLPRRSSLGWEVLYRHEVDFLRELSEHASPEQLGRMMRMPGSRPYALQPFILMCTYLGARQQHMLDLGISEGQRFPDERIEEISFLLDWWERLMSSYRSDGLLLPGQAGGSLQILDEQTIEEVASQLRPAPAERYAAVRRMAATLQLYLFILHGEQRDGIFGHGPYRLPDGLTLLFAEYNDLRNDYLPWAQTEVSNVYDNVLVAYAVSDLRMSCDMFGSVTLQPSEFADRLAGVALMRNDGGALRPIADEEIPHIQQAAASAQEELYLRAVEWDERYKIEYGAPLFANHLKAFFDLAGVDGTAAQRIMDACRSTGERMIEQLVGAEMPSVWTHMGSTQGDFFWPVVP